MRRFQPQSSAQEREGAAAVEFALILPFFVTLVLGVLELGWAFNASQVLAAAVREGARFGSMDHTGIVGDGESTNAKVIQDIKNFLEASGLPGQSAEVTITKENLPSQGSETQTSDPFDLDDPENEFQFYRITVTLPFNQLTATPPIFLRNSQISNSVVFRSAQSTLVSN